MNLSYLSLLPVIQNSSADIRALPRTPEGSIRKTKACCTYPIYLSHPAPRRADVQYLLLQKQSSLLLQRLRFVISSRQEKPQRGLSHGLILPQKILVILRENGKGFRKDLNLCRNSYCGKQVFLSVLGIDVVPEVLKTSHVLLSFFYQDHCKLQSHKTHWP